MNSQKIIINNNFILSLKDKVIMLLLILFSANPYFGEHSQYLIIIYIFVLFLLFPKIFNINFNNELIVLLIILYFISFLLLHKFLFDLDNTKTILKIFIYFIASYFSVKSLKYKFIDAYVYIVYILALISLVFFVFSYILPSMSYLFNFANTVFPLTNVTNPTLIIYTFDNAFYSGLSPLLRNAGFAWEAGGYATFLNIALFFYIFKNNLTFKQIFMDKVSLILIISIITTFSTAGYITLFFILSVYSFMYKSKIKYLFIILLGLTLLISFSNFAFLGDKITNQYEVAYKSRNRFGAAILDWEDIKKSPLVGWSRKEKVLFGSQAYTEISHRPNGITNLLRVYGFLYFIPLLFLLFISFKRYFLYIGIGSRKSRTLSLYLLIVILLMSFSQLILQKLIIKSFLFLFIIYKNNKNY